MKKYNRIMLGRGGCFAQECLEGGFIGTDFDINEDLTPHLYENGKDFNNHYVPIYMAKFPDKSKTSAGLSCGFLWTVSKYLSIGDIVLCPNGNGQFLVGEISSNYYYEPNGILPHRRNVKWLDKVISRSDMSIPFKNSSGSIGTCSDITKYAAEIETLLGNSTISTADVKTEEKPAATPHKMYLERALHKLFCTHLQNQDEVIYAKTIYHEKSNSKIDNQKWIHPDIVGVQFEDYEAEATKALLKATEPKRTISIYSFEMKREINSDSELKQDYFQALSNSSWANYGYLVAFDINETLKEEIARLNQAFGIGVILLQAHKIDILFPARKNNLDYDTIDKLCRANSDFSTFISKVSKVILASRDYTADSKRSFISICDPILENEGEIDKYCEDNNIPF